MLEVFYEVTTQIVTAWRGEESRQGIRPLREGEAKVMLDIVPPHNKGASVRGYIYVNNKLKLRPDFKPPEPERDLATEIDELKAKVEKLEIGIGIIRNT